jgi:hypothetical protein
VFEVGADFNGSETNLVFFFFYSLANIYLEEGHCVTEPYKRSVKGVRGGGEGHLCALFAWMSNVCLEPTISACSSFPRSRLDNSISWWYVELVLCL